MALQVLGVTKVYRALKVFKDKPDLLVLQVHLAQRVQLDLQVHKVSLVHREPTAFRVLRVLLDLLVLQALLVLREPLLPSLVLLALRVLLVQLGLLVHGALTVFPTLRLAPLL
jgi:hypothetical protein